MICPKTKSATHCLTEVFPIYQNKHWTIRQWDDRSIDPSSHGIILKIVIFIMYVMDGSLWNIEIILFRSIHCFVIIITEWKGRTSCRFWPSRLYWGGKRNGLCWARKVVHLGYCSVPDTHNTVCRRGLILY